MTYDDANRGKITNPERKKQLIDYSKLRYCNITPTDIDGYIEKNNEIFMFYEYKLLDAELPHGQKTAYTRLIDALTSADKNAVLFICRHDQSDTSKEIDGANSIVDMCYFKGQWFSGNNKTVKQASDGFIDYVKKVRRVNNEKA